MRQRLRDRLEALGWFLEDHFDLILSIIAFAVSIAALILRLTR